MGVLKRLIPAAALASCAALACSEATSPASVDPGVLEAGFATATATFNGSAAFQSLSALSAHFPQYAATAALRAALPALPAGAAAALRPVDERAAQLRLFASLRSPQALFPANVLGKTLEWDTVSHAFAVGAQAGAPATGIRILLYAVNPVTMEPVVPLQPLGAVDLTDKSTPAADQLGILLALGAATIADYDVTLSSGTVVTSIEAAGYIRTPQGSGRVDFDFKDVVNLQAQAISSTSQLTGPDGTAIFLDVEQTTTAVTFTVRVQQGGNRLEIAVNVADATGALAGTLKYNSVVAATITGTVDAPVFAGVTGRTLPAAEVAALAGIFDKAVTVATDLANAVYGPAGIVFN